MKHFRSLLAAGLAAWSCLAQTQETPPAIAGRSRIDWSGYASSMAGLYGGFRYVQGSWTVPGLATQPASNPEEPLLVWVGLDGWNWNHIVEQIGTEHWLHADGSQGNMAWLEFFPDGMTYLPLTMAAGDKIFAAVDAQEDGLFWFFIENLNTGDWLYYFLEDPRPADLTSAEWIVEGFQPPDLPPFGFVRFKDCYAAALDPGGLGHLGGIDNPPFWAPDLVQLFPPAPGPIDSDSHGFSVFCPDLAEPAPTP